MSTQDVPASARMLSLSRTVDLDLNNERLSALATSYARFRTEMAKLYAHDVDDIEPPVLRVADWGADESSK